jgi:hypothetical protein
MGKNEPKKRTVAYGRIAEQFRSAILAEDVKKLAQPKQDEPEDKAPQILSDPQGMIIRGRLLRFKPTITSYAKNFCLRLISEDDFLISVRNESRKMLTSVRSMGRVQITMAQVEKYVRDIVYTLAKMLQDISPNQIDIQMAPPLVDAVMDMVEQAFAERAALPDHEKVQEQSQPQGDVPANDPFKDFPPEIRSLIVQRMAMLGVQTRDMDTLKRMARQFGVDPDEAIEEMKQGRIPDSLKRFF